LVAAQRAPRARVPHHLHRPQRRRLQASPGRFVQGGPGHLRGGLSLSRIRVSENRPRGFRPPGGGHAGGSPRRGSGLAGKIATQPEREWTVLVFAGVVCILLVLAAFAGDRTGYVDELGLYNPSYMMAHYGNLTYPI